MHGIVQGVGFRPFIYRLAARFSLRGSISNTTTGVRIRVAGGQDHLDAFLRAVRQEAPPLAVITSLVVRPCTEPVSETGFVILASEPGERPTTLISPDITVCDDCLAEIMDPQNRRFAYPFTNCTNCGPRFTIISSLPYDRPNTSMAVFPMCADCYREYEDPLDRRFHAQPNACPICGPHLELHDADGPLESKDPVRTAARALREGKILALKGLGGFHLCVDGRNSRAVARLRRRKHRYAKPLAVMVLDAATARRYGRFCRHGEELLKSRARPIVLVPGKNGSGLAGEVAPGINEVGIMLPYTPLHYLLLAHADTPEVLVMTSGNRSGEPIRTDNREAVEHLGHIADLFLLHNRDILTRVDDSVARSVCGRVQMIRRSRGYAPMPVLLPQPVPELLACGAELKNTFCLARDKHAFVSQHIGELIGPENLVFYEESIGHFQELLEIEPALVACDLHPDYLSTVFARTWASARDLPLVRIQHHHAHAAAVMAEHNLSEVLAVVFDGAGLGSDGTIWGGEFLRVGGSGFFRLGHLAPFALPGGDAAAREPWRVALSLLEHLPGQKDCNEILQGLAPAPGSLDLLRRMLAGNINCPLTTSCGRLFDGVSALLGLRGRAEYEGQAAMELEALAWSALKDPGSLPGRVDTEYPVELEENNGLLEVNIFAMLGRLCSDFSRGRARENLALAFHCWLAAATAALINRLARATGLSTVVLAGGCMQNRLLLSMLRNTLEQDGYEVYTGEKIPVNDGGIALGQAYIGGMTSNVSGNSHAGT